MSELYDFDEFASDEDGWNHATGAPSLRNFGTAIQVWSVMQNAPTSVADAARVFNCPHLRVIEAVEEHPWMFLEGARDDFAFLMIEHEGE